MGYHLIEPEYLEFKNNNSFSVVSLDISILQRFAVCSDGFEEELAQQIWNIKHPFTLQRKMNAWSEQYKRFSDDATVIAVEVIK